MYNLHFIVLLFDFEIVKKTHRKHLSIISNLDIEH